MSGPVHAAAGSTGNLGGAIAIGAANATSSVEAVCARFGHIPLRLSADVALPPLTMRALCGLHVGQVFESSYSVADDLLLTLGGAPLCWGRFAAVDGRMVLRVVRLA